MAYKIKISCTDITELQFNNKPINNKNYKSIIYWLVPEEDNRIEYINISHRSVYGTNFCVKELEIFFNTQLTELEFEQYIKKMINLSFYSKINNYIEFINTKLNRVIHRYDFMTIKRRDLNIIRSKSFKYIYKDIKLYCKN